jgi:hypothetical protein
VTVVYYLVEGDICLVIKRAQDCLMILSSLFLLGCKAKPKSLHKLQLILCFNRPNVGVSCRR